MNPGDVIARAGGAYAILAIVGNTAAVVPLRSVSAIGPRMRGDVAIDPTGAGIKGRHVVARCYARQPVAVSNERIVGRLTPAELATVVHEIRRANASAYVVPGRAVVSFDDAARV